MKLITVVLILSFMFSISSTSHDIVDINNIGVHEVTESVTSVKTENVQIVVYYLHSNQRCMTCKKLESFSEEALTTGYENKLKDSSVVWRVVNFEEEKNEHYTKDYKLYTQSLILSKIKDGKEIEWKNLDQIWKLVGDKKEFITYVQNEINLFMNPKEK